MQLPSQILDVALSTVWKEVLKPLGFKRVAKRGFTRHGPDDSTQRVVFQLVNARTDPEVDIYFSIGWSRLRRVEASWLERPEDAASAAQFGDSVGHLTPPFRFRSVPLTNAHSLAAAFESELRDNVLPFLAMYSDLASAVECWDGEYPYARTNARLYGPLGRLALGDTAGAVASARRHLAQLQKSGADEDLLLDQRRLIAFLSASRAPR